jgi:Holliday junction resolvasome RuvABC endonuclease subunit
MGYAVSEIHNNKNELLHFGMITLKGKNTESPGMRFIRARKEITALIKDYQPDLIIYEAVKRWMSSASAHVYNGILAVLLMTADEAGVEYVGVSPKEIKKYATGNGNASKDDIITWASTYWGRPVTDDNEADALAMCYYASSMIAKDVQTKQKLL